MVHEVICHLFAWYSMMLTSVVAQDDPSQLAETLVEFWRRNERVMVGVKKVGEL